MQVVNESGNEDDDGFKNVANIKLKKRSSDKVPTTRSGNKEETKDAKSVGKKSSGVTTSKSCAQNPSSTWHLHHHHHDHDHMDKEQRLLNKVLKKVDNDE